MNGERRVFSPAERLDRIIRERLPARRVFPSWSELPRGTSRRSAVLVPLFPSEETLSILFLRRASNLSRHGGEICFPGGMKDSSDESPLRTALRETEEETGIPPDAVEPLMLLPPEHTVVSDVEVFPVLGVVRGVDPVRGLLLPPSEIAAAYVVDLASLPSEPRRRQIVLPPRNGMETSEMRTVSYPEYDLPDGTLVWGVTARILERVFSVS